MRYYVRSTLVHWKELVNSNPFAHIEFEVNSQGYMEVYDSLEDLGKDYGDQEPYFTVELDEERLGETTH